MALTNRYTKIIQGGITSTGNSLGLTSNTSSGNNYDQYVLISTNTGLQVPGYPPGTTTNYALSSSNAYLNIPSGSTVVYAELMWTTFNASTNAVTFSTPVQQNIPIAPVNSESYVPYKSYWYSADVTNYVNAGGAGYYTVGNVYVSSLGTAASPSWTLVVAYKNESLPYRYITINTGYAYVTGITGTTYTITNFFTPSSGTLTGYLLMSYTFGDFLDGANLRVGPTTSSYTAIGNPGPTTSPWNGTPPYNPQGQMFTGLVCIADPLNPNMGDLDTRGSFGTYNVSSYVTLGYPPTSRSLYDISGFDISKTLIPSQSNLNINVYFLGGGGAVIQNESVQIDVNSANLAPANKIVSKNYATLGDTLVYTITTVNTGLLTANNVVFIDTIPTGTAFIPGSVVVNNVAQSSYDPSPPNGINIGNIAPNSVATIMFDVIVNTSIPFSYNPVQNQGTFGYSFVPGPGVSTIVSSVATNLTTTTISFATLSSSKIVNKSYANIGDILTYTIPLTNNGTTIANNIIFIDTIPSTGITLVTNSFMQDGVIINGNPNPPGVTLPNSITSYQTSTITYQVLINSIPSPNPILNSASVNYDYTINPSLPNGSNGSTYTNIVSTQVNNANLENISKSVDKDYATCGDILTYTITLPNNGNVNAFNVILKDTLPSGTILVNNSVTVNGVTLPSGTNPQAGITIGTIAAGSYSVVTFQVTIDCTS